MKKGSLSLVKVDFYGVLSFKHDMNFMVLSNDQTFFYHHFDDVFQAIKVEFSQFFESTMVEGARVKLRGQPELV